MASQSANPECGRNQNRAVCPAVSSICGTADRLITERVFGSHFVLDDGRSRKQAARISELLQQASRAYFTGGPNTRSGRERVAAVRKYPLLPLAIPLPRSLSDAGRGLIFQRICLAVVSNGPIDSLKQLPETIPFLAL